MSETPFDPPEVPTDPFTAALMNATLDALEREPTDDELISRPYADDRPGSLGENDPRLGFAW